VHRAVLVAICACGRLGFDSSSNVDASGNYSVATTNRDNGCNIFGWTVGQQTTGIPVTITQQQTNASADVMGSDGGFLDALLGGHVFTGTVDGNSLDLRYIGTKTNTQGNCTYTFNSEILATLSGDALSGRIDYVGAGNGASDCAAIQGCVSYTEYNGSRPPR
jgi:hypothetical protein